MQPYTSQLARTRLTLQTSEVVIGKGRFLAEINEGQGWVRERVPRREKRYPIMQVMGGKNVYYFLTPLDHGRLQVLPLAYDLRKKSWYDTAASGVRHFPDRQDEALDWTDRMFTFNTSCLGCHVSQLATNYDLASDTYQTVWLEPGINCESCHGPSGKHVRAAEALPKGEPMKDLKIIRTKTLPAESLNDLCATCHAKMIPLSTTFLPGNRFFDHYDLVTLEHPDFYPDGRDLGENYTYTTWLMNSCLKSGQLDCNHCHTPSGRERFKDARSNQSCLPCHVNKVKNPVAHTHHQTGSSGNRCVACHMPKTDFAAMSRRDHSLLPPAPAASLAFQSPNACNLCHTDRDARWADSWVRKWHPHDYQKPVLYRARLIEEARKGEWARVREMLALLKDRETNQVLKTSLVRLMHGCPDQRKWPVLMQLVQRDPSPLVRASAASGLAGSLTPEAVPALLAATTDDYRLVRIRAAAALARVPLENFNERDRSKMEVAINEFFAAMNARPDDWASYANLGDYFWDRQQPKQAIAHYETATRLEPRMLGPWVNMSLAYNAIGRNDKAEESLRRALALEPENGSANFNLGLLLAEMGRIDEAERTLRKALKIDPQNAVAAYNLAVIASKRNLDEAVTWCRKAATLRPEEPKYAQSLAFYLREKGDLEGAIQVLRDLIKRQPTFEEPYLALGQIYESQGKLKEARVVYGQALTARTRSRQGCPNSRRLPPSRTHRIQG
jgi:tetratricopeptide (TPR) repeat protein